MASFTDTVYQWVKGDKNWHIPYNNALTALKTFMGDKGANADIGSGLTSAQTEITNARGGKADLQARINPIDSEIVAARGAALSITARLDVGINADGTLKTTVNAGVDFAASGDATTFTGVTAFTVPTDRTATYTKGRRLMLTLSGGAVYGTVLSAVFGSVTTITLEESVLDATLSAVSFGITSLGATGSAPKHPQININQNSIKDLSVRTGTLEAATNTGLTPLDAFTDASETDLTATTMDTANNAAQVIVNVASTTGFTVGASVDLLHAVDPTLHETAKIVSIQAGVSLTMLANITNSYPVGSSVKRSGAAVIAGKLKLPIEATDLGDGRDGVINITTAITKTIDNEIVGSLRTGQADAIERLVTVNPVGTSITVVAGEEAGFSAGDQVVLINKQGGAGDTVDVGQYEFFKLLSVSSGILNLNKTIVNSYDGASFAAQKISVQRLPQYASVTLNNASAVLTCNAWNGAKGGLLAFVCAGAVTVTTGKIHADAKGYRGSSNGVTFGEQGEGEAGIGVQNFTRNGIGGGGFKDTVTSDGAGGGGYGVVGATGHEVNSEGGNAIGDINLTVMFMGGAGGAGRISRKGGNGGGILRIIASTITVTGSISSNGENGVLATATPGGSGGGAGGTLYLIAINLIANNGVITAIGGTGGLGVGGVAFQAGGDGGVGRGLPEYQIINSQIFPNATEENLVFIPNPGVARLSSFGAAYLAARYRSLVVSRPQRLIDIATFWLRQSVTISHGATSGTAAASIISGITAGEQNKYGVGDSVVIKKVNGFYLENVDGTIYAPKVTVNSVSGQVTVDTVLPETFVANATLQRLDAIPRASLVAAGAAENMAGMSLETVEAIAGSTDLRCEWAYDPAGTGQDVNVEIGLSTEDAAQQGNVFVDEYTSLLEMI